MDGPVNPYELYQQMADVMTRNVTVVRYNDKLAETLQAPETLARDYERIGVKDKSMWNNTTTVFVRELKSMINLAKVITAGALARDESRGSHYKPEFPERDDEAWLKTTLAAYDPALDGPRLSYEEVDLSLIEPRKRDSYDGCTKWVNAAHRRRRKAMEANDPVKLGINEDHQVPYQAAG